LSSSDSFYWHDYETSGKDPDQDRPWQFAGVRTNAALELIDDPLMLFARPSPDRLPHPAAIRVTGITPQQAEEKGLPETAFIQRIHDELARPKTCAVGYNSIRFDDEVTRFTLWRNFRDPYRREWQHGNSRWDLLDVARALFALRPEGVVWPRRDDGLPSFRLEDLTAANEIDHAAAHDALADVMATIEIARLFKRRQPELFDTLFAQRTKRGVSQLINLQALTPLVHVSGMFGAERNNLALVVPVAWHPDNNSEVICVDLSQPPQFLDEDPDKVKEYLFTRQASLPVGVQRPPLKTIRLNRAPVLLPMHWVAGAVAERLGLDGAAHRAHLAAIREHRASAPDAFVERLQNLWRDRDFPPRNDPDRMLYDGFVGDADRALCDEVISCAPGALATRTFPFSDPRLQELLFRYRARNFPESLNAEEQAHWREHCAMQWQEGTFTRKDFDQALAEERAAPDLTPETEWALGQLEAWVSGLSVERGTALQ
jgi:exodeoxyribonuclease-1